MLALLKTNFLGFFKKYFVVVALFIVALPQMISFNSLGIEAVFVLLLIFTNFNFAAIKSKNNFYLFASIASFILFFIIKIQTLFLLGFICTLFFLIEYYFSKLSFILFVACILVLPVSKSLLNTISFDWRLATTNIVSYFLKFIDAKSFAEGNIIHFRNNIFGVDDACSGINTMQLGLLMTSTTLLFFEKKRINKLISHNGLVLFYLLSILLIIFANTQRVVLCILYNINENTASHQIVGLICLAAFLIAPIYFIAKFVFKKKGFFLKEIQTKYVWEINKGITVVLILITGVASVYSMIILHCNNAVSTNFKKINGYKHQAFKYGVHQYYNKNALIYLKPPVAFYSSSHHPRLCWRGSGYEFTNEKFETISTKCRDKKIITAILKNKNGQQLYTAYWFANGQKIISGELEWRWQSLINNEQFELYNVSAISKEILIEEVKKLLE